MFLFDQFRKGDTPLRVIGLIIFISMLVLLGGVWYVQIVASKRYVESEKTQSFRTVRIPAVRGQILDRNGLILAEDRPQYSVGLYLESMSPLFRQEYSRALRAGNEESLRKAGRRLARSERDALALEARFRVVSNVVHELSLVMDQPIEVEARQFHQHFHNCRVLPFPVLEDMTLAQVARFEEQPVNPTGMDVEVQPVRFYPHGTTAAHILGHLRRDTDFSFDDEAMRTYRLQDVRGVYRGVLGLEGVYDEELRGRAGVKFVQVNNIGYRQAEEVWSPAIPGKNLVLTLDLPLQKVAERALRSTPLGPEVRGAVVVMNVHNGDILALASNPSFDPSVYLGRISHEQFAQLNDPELKPLVNRATQGIYPPGSIIKMVTALAALEAGAVDPGEKFYARGFYPIGPGIRCTAPAGDYAFLLAMERSCNCYFIEHGLRAGTERLLEMGHRFFLGQSAKVPTLQNSPGIFPAVEEAQQDRRSGRWTDGNTANLCIGQDRIAVTPIQMAVMTAAIANGGKVYWPRMVERLEPQAPDGTKAVVFPPRLRGELGVRPENLRLVRDSMLSVVEGPHGTGRQARVTGLRIAGKTGTAEVKTGRRLDHYIAWFTSFAPYEDPRYAVVVMVERGAGGGVTSAPVAQEIYREILRREQQAAPGLQTAALME